MKLYHGTTQRNLDCINAEGFLGSEISDCTTGSHQDDGVVYLTEDIEEARQYGEKVLEVHLEGVTAHPHSADTEHFYAFSNELNNQSWYEEVE